jgi:diguanylate cyclase (GGDEF)-like protein
LEVTQRRHPVRRRLESLLAGEPEEAGRLLERLVEIRRTEGIRACAEALRLLAHLDLPEERAEKLLADLLRHRVELAARLGRDPGLAVAAVDYLSNIERLLANPAIVERAQLDRTERSALVDPLTGLYNRRQFVAALTLELRRSQRYELELALLMLDLDGFKRLNDDQGHLFGDLVLQRVAQVLRRSVRDADSACRYGGDEFAVVLPETDRLGAYALAERVRERIHERFGAKPVRGLSVVVRLSGGIAAYPQDGAHASDLVAAADRALYLAKSRGRDRTSLFHGERRGAVRYPARGRTQLELRPAGQAPLPVGAENLSVTGALLVVEPGCASGVRVQLRYRGGATGAGTAWLRDARVVRVERSGARGTRVAVAFDEPLSEGALRELVTRGRPFRPGRHAGA